jgi:hypothetical protein
VVTAAIVQRAAAVAAGPRATVAASRAKEPG